MEKYKIEKDSVQETLIIPLYGRRLCSQRFPDLYGVLCLPEGEGETPVNELYTNIEQQEENRMQQKRNQQAEIRLGSHGEDYGSWMSNPVFYIIGGITALAVVLAALSFSVFHITVLGVLFSVVAAALVTLLVWITWIRRQYAFGGGGIMEQVHRVVLSHLDYDGQGSLLEVGCGSGALSIRAALTWPES